MKSAEALQETYQEPKRSVELHLVSTYASVKHLGRIRSPREPLRLDPR